MEAISLVIHGPHCALTAVRQDVFHRFVVLELCARDVAGAEHSRASEGSRRADSFQERPSVQPTHTASASSLDSAASPEPPSTLTNSGPPTGPLLTTSISLPGLIPAPAR
jgi:hypothetical protein